MDVKKETLQSTELNPTLAPSDSTLHELSNLRLENQLLRNEVQSLNQEMASLIQRAKETQAGEIFPFLSFFFSSFSLSVIPFSFSFPLFIYLFII